jgi:hypothetical protein
VFGVVVSTCEEALAERGVIRLEMFWRKNRIGREVDSRNGERAGGVDYRDRRSLDGGGAETVEEGMLDGRLDKDGTASASGAGR